MIFTCGEICSVTFHHGPVTDLKQTRVGHKGTNTQRSNQSIYVLYMRTHTHPYRHAHGQSHYILYLLTYMYPG